MMPGMTDLQKTLVADRIAALDRDAAALRAERQRDHLREHAVAGTNAFDHPADLPSSRVRFGHWLMALGQSIAGSRGPTADTPRLTAAPSVKADDPCGESRDRDRMAPAA